MRDDTKLAIVILVFAVVFFTGIGGVAIYDKKLQHQKYELCMQAQKDHKICSIVNFKE